MDTSSVFVKNSCMEPCGLSYVNFDEGVPRPDANKNSNHRFEFYVKDHLGSTRAVLSEDGSIGEATAYLAYGMEMPIQVSTGLPAVQKFTKKSATLSWE